MINAPAGRRLTRGARSAAAGGGRALTRRSVHAAEQDMLFVLARAGLIFLTSHIVFVSLALLLAG